MRLSLNLLKWCCYKQARAFGSSASAATPQLSRARTEQSGLALGEAGSDTVVKSRAVLLPFLQFFYSACQGKEHELWRACLWFECWFPHFLAW